MHPAVLEFLGQQVKQGIQPSLTQGSFRKLPIALPPVDIQQEVAEVAQAFRTKIEVPRKGRRTDPAAVQAGSFLDGR
ncbi:restriction endonuclease subunit S [Actinoplanes octamycinicus]